MLSNTTKMSSQYAARHNLNEKGRAITSQVVDPLCGLSTGAGARVWAGAATTEAAGRTAGMLSPCRQIVSKVKICAWNDLSPVYEFDWGLQPWC